MHRTVGEADVAPVHVARGGPTDGRIRRQQQQAGFDRTTVNGEVLIAGEEHGRFVIVGIHAGEVADRGCCQNRP